jgi:hypothetical protein
VRNSILKKFHVKNRGRCEHLLSCQEVARWAQMAGTGVAGDSSETERCSFGGPVNLDRIAGVSKFTKIGRSRNNSVLIVTDMRLSAGITGNTANSVTRVVYKSNGHSLSPRDPLEAFIGVTNRNVSYSGMWTVQIIITCIC